MDTRSQEQGLYTISVEGATVEALREFMSGVVAVWSEGENQEGLITATPEHVAKLRELLRVRRIEPAADGVYVGRNGQWNIVRGGAVAYSGYWKIPVDLLASFSATTASVGAPVGIPSDGGAAAVERDPVCGMLLKPGQEEANTTYQGRTYHFCSAECRDVFLKDPSSYAERAAPSGS
jgi:YHS domain-containing protein